MDNNSPPWADDYTGHRQIVQVRIPGARRSYAYTWDGEPLEEGDWVELPGNDVSPDGTEGRVEGFGADGYKGPMKAIVGPKERQDPWMARMRQAKDRSERLTVYRRAQKAGISGERLAAIVAEGKKAGAAQDKAYTDALNASPPPRRRRPEYDRQDDLQYDVNPYAVPPLTAAEDAAEHRARRRRKPDPDYDIPASSLGRVDAAPAATGWGEWE